MYTLKEYESRELPPPDKIIGAAFEFAAQIDTQWARSRKTYPGGVMVYTHWYREDFWAARASIHTPEEVTYEKMRQYVMENHTKHESEYISMVEGYESLPLPADVPKGWHSELVHYKFPFPLSKRDMAIWLTSGETIPGEQFIVVTLPRAISTARTKATYISVEVVTRTNDGGVKWVMATSSDAGGWLPQKLQRSKVADELPKDVSQFLDWVRMQP